eukprot:s29_g36.t1
MDLWEELHWRCMEDFKDILRRLKKEVGRETMTLSELKFHALLPGPDGQAWLVMPTVFDLQRPGSWFQEEVLPRIDRKQERLLWNLTWQGSQRRDRAPQAGPTPTAGGVESDKPSMKALWGPKLTTEEVNRAKERAPLDRQGQLLCWGNLCHVGCSVSGCQRSHESLRGSFESLDPAVQLQFLRRGGLKRMKMETKESVNLKVKEIRAKVEKEKSEKVQDGKRRASGNDKKEKTGTSGEQPNSGEVPSDGKAGSGQRHVRFWEPPEEFKLDYTANEDVRQLVDGPSHDWGGGGFQPDRQHGGRDGISAPVVAHQLVKEAQTLGDSEVMRRLEEASDDLYAWAAARLARDPQVTFQTLMTEMATYGSGELANEAANLLEGDGDAKAGSFRLYVHPAQWSGDGPGQGVVEVDGQQWHFHDYKEEVPMTEELASLLKLPDPSREKRQCVTLSLAAGVFKRQHGRWPSLKEAQEGAQELRLEQARLAVEASVTIGQPEEVVSPVEHEARIYIHDLVTANHEKDFKSLAMFPVQSLQDARAVVLRAVYKGGLMVESVVGGHWSQGGWILPVLIWKGHMVVLDVPDGFDWDAFLQEEEYSSTPALGFTFFWHSRHTKLEPHLVVSIAGFAEETERLAIFWLPADSTGEGGDAALVLQEVFAGTGRITRSWRKNGVALEPVEVRCKCVVDCCPLHYSYCDWQLQNGGTRTFEAPLGTGSGPLAQREADGNVLSEFAAELFEKALGHGQFPVCESSASSGRYPKQWDLPSWRRILQRDDVDVRVGTWTPGQGVGPHHKHIALKGARDGQSVTRCTEAGAYAWDFVNAVVTVLQSTLGGVPVFKPQGAVSGHAGGKRGRGESEKAEETEDDFEEVVVEEDEQNLVETEALVNAQIPAEINASVPVNDRVVDEDQALAEDETFAEDEVVENEVTLEELEQQQAEAEMIDLFGEEAERALRRAGRRQWCSPDGSEQQQLIDEILDENGHEVVETESLGYEPSLAGDEPAGVWANPEDGENSESSEAGDGDEAGDPAGDPAGGNANPVVDYWEGPDFVAGTIRRVHVVRRQCLFVPDVPRACQIQDERRTFLVNHRNVRVRIEDNWREAGGVNVGYGQWTGFTVFPLQNFVPDWDRWQSYGMGPSDEDEAEREDEERSEADDGAEGPEEGSAEGDGRAGASGKGGRSTESRSQYASPSEEAQRAAMEYVMEVKENFENSAEAWMNLLRKGNALVQVAGSVKAAAESLWEVREDQGLMNLAGVDSCEFEEVLHPDHLDYLREVYKQVAKDVKKHRVLVVDSSLKELVDVVSSPFEAVDKMLPDRTISSEKRVVHDQRTVNQATSKLLWVDPADVSLFAGDLPWQPGKVFGEETAEVEGPKGEVTVIYFISSFGFSGSPGEWCMWGRATEEYHRGHRPTKGRRDMTDGFDAKVLVDDCILVEPWVGLRPRVSAEVFEDGVTKLLGSQAVNKEKDEVEGFFKTTQTVWGGILETQSENASGILTGWAAIVPGLCNELKAADKFLKGTDGRARVTVNLKGDGTCEWETKTAWEDLWELFEVCRWLSSRTAQWELLFATTLREMLPPLERLSLPGEWGEAVFVSSDATTLVVGAIDWKHGCAFRETVAELKPWILAVLTDEELRAEGETIVVHLAEMLSFVAFACAMAERWKNRIVIYAGDNMVVKRWLHGRKSAVRGGRIFVRVVNMLEMRWRLQILAGWWRTYHNIDADFVTRCSADEFQQFVDKKGWQTVDVKPAVKQALEDSHRFGPCFLYGKDDEDRKTLLQLKERRMQRQVQHEPQIPWPSIRVVEWKAQGRKVRDFEVAAGCLGARLETPADGGPVILCATLGMDGQGRHLCQVLETAKTVQAWLVVVEGPRAAMARRRRCLLVRPGGALPEAFEESLVRVASPVPIHTILKQKPWEDLVWRRPARLQLESGIPRDRMLPCPIGHYAWNEDGDRETCHSTDGPCLWPKLKDGVEGMEPLYVFDRRGPPGHLRRLTDEEVWRLQGRLTVDLRAETDVAAMVREGCRATGAQTASSLLVWAGHLVEGFIEEGSSRAGMCSEVEGPESLAQILVWLRRWRRGEYGRRAGGSEELEKVYHVNRWAEAWWISMLDDSDCSSSEDENDDAYAGGRKAKRTVAEVAKEVSKQFVTNVGLAVRPFCGEVGERVEEWLEENLQGDKSPATEKAYAEAWAKWKAWAKRQEWLSEYLDRSEDAVERENKLLAYIGYLGWLGASVNTIRQSIFAIKLAHKRAFGGDPGDAAVVGQGVGRCPRALELFTHCCRFLHGVCGWFFMLRCKEFAESNGVDKDMILRGCDVRFSTDGVSVEFNPEEVTLQLRKTKVDQLGYGEAKTLKAT